MFVFFDPPSVSLPNLPIIDVRLSTLLSRVFWELCLFWRELSRIPICVEGISWETIDLGDASFCTCTTATTWLATHGAALQRSLAHGLRSVETGSGPLIAAAVVVTLLAAFGRRRRGGATSCCGDRGRGGACGAAARRGGQHGP